MATTGNVKGNLLGLYISTDDGTNYTLVGSATSCTLSINNDTLDVTKKSASGNRELMYGLQTATITAEGFVKFDDTQGSEQLRSIALGASDDSTYLARFSTGVTGDKEVYFNAIITSFEETAAVNEIATYSLTLESAGAITEGTVS
jgi:predicted secreted protein